MRIHGAGGGGGGSTSSGATEAPDSLRSKSYAKLVDMVGEGELEEVCINGLQGVLLDDVVVQNADGTYNYNEVVLETRSGTLNQSRMNIADTTESSYAVGVEMTYNNPVEKIVLGTSIDYLKVVVAVPSLTFTDSSTGNISGNSVQYRIEYHSNDNPSWKVVPTTGSAIEYEFLTYSGEAVTNYSHYRVICDIYPARYYSINEYNAPTHYSFQYSLNAGANWITLKRDVISEPISSTFNLEVTQADSILFRLLVETVSTFTPEGSLLQAAYSQIQNVWGGNPTGTAGVQTISDKTTSAYEREHAFRVIGEAPFTVRCTRLTKDSTSSLSNNKTVFQSISAVTEEKFTYPGSALVGLSFDATQFTSIPSRSYLCKLRRVKVPVNYDPLTREYNGFWDGSFKVAWTDNPAWCFYDLVTDTRCGLGDRIPEGYVDAAALYEIAQYCDEWVPDGVGGYEPRFTCNLLLQTREEAYKVISDMASIFRGITYWANGSIIPVQDSPKDKKYAFNNTNVVDGQFLYQGSSLNSRYNAVSVTWNDPSNLYKQAVEYVQDDDAILSMGFVNHTTLTALGCTSRSMARRAGKWLLYTNTYETEAVSFQTGMEGVVPFPGDIISITDSLRSNERMGGRVLSYTAGNLEIDSSILFVSGVDYTVSCVAADGTLVEQTFTGDNTSISVLPVTFSKDVAKDSIFVIASESTSPEQLFRVMGVVEKEKSLYEISAAAYYPSKYGMIEFDERLSIPQQTVEFLKSVTNITVTEIAYSDGASIRSKARFEWTAPQKAASYDIFIKYPDNTTSSFTQKQNYFELLDATVGLYVVNVTAKDVLGNKAQTYQQEVQLVGLAFPPSTVENLSVKSMNGSGYATWKLHPDLDVRAGGYIVLKYTSKTVDVSWEDGIVVAQVSGGQTQSTVPIFAGTYMAKAVDTSGIYSPIAAFADSRFAEIQSTNVMATLTEHPSFSGTKTNLYVDGAALILSGVGYLTGTENLTGIYDFHDVIDLTGVFTVRVSGTVGGFAAVVGDTVGSRPGTVGSWETFGGEAVSDALLTLQISTTDSDPNSVGAVWSDWNDFILGDYVARGFRFRLLFEVAKPDHIIYCTELSVSVDAVDRTTGQDDVAVGTGGFSVIFQEAFAVTPAIAISIDNMQDGDYYLLTSKSARGFTAQIMNNGSPVARQIDWIATGYGRKQT